MRQYPNTIYARVNARFFGAKLPKVQVHWATDEELKGALGCTVHDPEKGKMWIYLNDRYKVQTKIWAFTLLHEMAHVEQFCLHPKCKNHHGRVWQTIMKRLAKDGAFENLW